MNRTLITRLVLIAPMSALCALSLSACGSDGHTDADSSPAARTASAPATASSPGNKPSAAVETQASASPSSPSTSGEVRSDCTSDNFTGVKLVAAGQEMNSLYYDLQLTGNKTTCRIDGYPGFSLLDADGKQIGKAASHAGGTAGGSVTLKPGQTLHAQVKTPNKGVADGNCDAKAAKIKVYPPNNTAPLIGTETAGIRACAGSLSVTKVSASASPS
ncbi:MULTISPECIES: DUF4232 domain-containing protein [unclassified Streptomyces]|uniref:DUF4232 domain-containing protein n=1 Tax=unclassified Streptomyces TaxID=2593676 RepID=UPI000DB95433|nr:MULTISPECIES: DUF4232 domain-containing protein [unclassified Streptomyces]MYT69776.1 DUF4232 domain-containing protein [Streptomyces sp. SID8367]RAJ70407.1 uncharacterized protein DUF4232 [Streptomyces sp. PsTaAH-137]